MVNSTSWFGQSIGNHMKPWTGETLQRLLKGQDTSTASVIVRKDLGTQLSVLKEKKFAIYFLYKKQINSYYLKIHYYYVRIEGKKYSKNDLKFYHLIWSLSVPYLVYYAFLSPHIYNRMFLLFMGSCFLPPLCHPEPNWYYSYFMLGTNFESIKQGNNYFLLLQALRIIHREPLERS